MSSIRAGSYAVVVATMLAACARGSDRAADTVPSGGAVAEAPPSSSASTPATAATSGGGDDSAGATHAAASIRTASAASVGTYLTDASGRALYMFERDRKNASMCTGACAKAWPPFAASAPASADSSVRAAMVGTISRSDGGTQATYNGMPLYYYEDDEKPGDITGQGKNEFGGLWYLVSPSGQKNVKSNKSRG